jgi:hypothetical protein
VAKSKGGAAGNPFGSVLDSLSAKMRDLDAAADQAARAHTNALAPLAGMIDLFQRLSSIPIVGAFTPLLGAFQNLSRKLEAAGDKGLSFGDKMSVLGGFAGAGIAAFQNLAGAVEKFAGLLSPVALEMFNRAVKDTSAAVGVALLPVLRVMTGVVREAGELILPITRQLEPVFRRLADTMGEQLAAEMESLAEVVEALIPLFDLLADVNALMLEVTKPVIEAVGSLARMLAPVIRLNVQALEAVLIPLTALAQMAADATRALFVFGEALAAAFGVDIDLSDVLGSLKTEADRMREGFRELLKTMLLLSAAIMKTVSSNLGDRFIDAMLRASRGPVREATQGLRPAEGAHYVTGEQFGKDVLQAASMAGFGGAAKKTQEELLDAGFKGVLEEMKGNKDAVQRIIDAVKDGFRALPGALADAIRERARQAFNPFSSDKPGQEVGFNRATANRFIPGLGFLPD